MEFWSESVKIREMGRIDKKEVVRYFRFKDSVLEY